MGDLIAAGGGVVVLVLPGLSRAFGGRAGPRASIIKAGNNPRVSPARGGGAPGAGGVRAPGLPPPGPVGPSVSRAGDWEELVEPWVGDVMTHLPDRYDLVIRAGARSEARVA